MKILITGHTGLKGGWLARVLLEGGHVIHGISIRQNPRGPLGDSGKAPSNFSETLLDIRDSRELRETVREFNPSIIFHMAAVTTVTEGYERPLETFSTNVSGSINVFEAALESNCELVVNVTSDKVYRNLGKLSRPFMEDDPLGGSRDPYSKSKAIADQVAQDLSNALMERGTKVLNARAGNVIGPLDTGKSRLMSDIYKAIEENVPLVIRNSGHYRPWQDVRDVLRGYLLLADCRGKIDQGSAINFGPDQSDVAVTVGEIARLVRDRFADLNLIELAQEERLEAAELSIDSSLAASSLGWRTLIPIQRSVLESVELTLDWRRERNERYSSWLFPPGSDLLEIASRL